MSDHNMSNVFKIDESGQGSGAAADMPSGNDKKGPFTGPFQPELPSGLPVPPSNKNVFQVLTADPPSLQQAQQELHHAITRLVNKLKETNEIHQNKDAIIEKHKNVTDALMASVRVCENNAYKLFPNHRQIVHDLFAPVNKSFMSDSRDQFDTTTTTLSYDLVPLDAHDVEDTKELKKEAMNLHQEEFRRAKEDLQNANAEIARRAASEKLLWDAIQSTEVKAHQDLPYHSAVVDKTFEYLFNKMGREHPRQSDDTLAGEVSDTGKASANVEDALINITERLDNSKVSDAEANEKSREGADSGMQT